MKIAMLFPDFGTQFVGMGKELYDEYRIVQEYFEEAANCLDINFVRLCFASSDIEVGQMQQAYTSVFLVSSAIHAVLKEEGIEATVFAGYNFGEYSALVAAGCITLPDGLYLLTKLSGFYETLLADLDVAIIRVRGIGTQQLQDICLKASRGENRATIAMYNSEDEHVVSGHRSAVDYVRELAGMQKSVSIDDLPNEVGLHSDLMDSVARNLKIYLEKIDFKDMKVPLLCAIDGHAITQGQEIKERVVRHIASPVVWTRVLHSIDACDIIVEIGPGTSLSKMVKMVYPDKKIIAINKKSDIEELKRMISTVDEV